VLDLRVDQQFIDAIANGLGELTKHISSGLRRLQNGFVRSYALAVLAGVVVILGYLILK
jgi:NADH-quinone oxidoreductase subunit L